MILLSSQYYQEVTKSAEIKAAPAKGPVSAKSAAAEKVERAIPVASSSSKKRPVQSPVREKQAAKK